MPGVVYPYRVKVDGVYYEAGTVITVEDADEHAKNGAVVVKTAAAAPKKAAQRKTAQAQPTK